MEPEHDGTWRETYFTPQQWSRVPATASPWHTISDPGADDRLRTAQEIALVLHVLMVSVLTPRQRQVMELYYLEKAVPNAVHCALKSAPEHSFCAGLLTGAEAWLQIAEYDPAYLKHARLWMDLAAEDMNQGPDVMDACLCARTWARFPGPESVTESEAMLKYAQELCDQTAATEGPESGLAKEGLSLLCRTRDQIRERADL
ncbi:MAG: hypothetical protein QGH42_01550 [Kiritimatiellia bacterium]|jgi:hypothetical protein|nr:hypothetical protein [Kiritimatiellia bacterium]